MSGTGPPPLFVYGSLLDPAFTSRLLEREVTSEPATLTGFELLRLDGYPLPAIFVAEGESVAGRLYRGLTETDYQRLDRYEGLDEGLYRRELATVVAGPAGVEPEPAHVYLLTEKSLQRLGVL